MLKKSLALALAVLMLFAFATGCRKKPVEGSSSKKPSGNIVSDVVSEEPEESSGIAENEWPEDEYSSEPESEPESDPDTTVGDVSSDWDYEWTLETSSAFFRDDPAALESVTISSEIKHYDNPDTLMIGSFHLSMSWTNAYGTDKMSKEREFADVVAQKYFNTYLLGAGVDLLTQAKYVAEAGATIWLSVGNFDSTKTTIDAHIKNVKYYLDLMEANGYGDLVNGFYWDEPIWHGQTNDDFLAQTKALYQNFGLRNFPVFACGEFTEFEGNEGQLGIDADKMRKLLPAAGKYLTDVAYDSYSVDVREGKSNGTYIDKLNKTYPNIVDGKSYYTEYRKILENHIGHPVNYWWYPCAYETGLWSGGRADESYCMGHLEFMAEEAINSPRGGGVIIYTFPIFGEDKIDYGFEHHMDIKDEYGNWAAHPEIVPKWEDYCDMLRYYAKTFSGIKADRVTLDV